MGFFDGWISTDGSFSFKEGVGELSFLHRRNRKLRRQREE
jgi:hypothetical protein